MISENLLVDLLNSKQTGLLVKLTNKQKYGSAFGIATSVLFELTNIPGRTSTTQ